MIFCVEDDSNIRELVIYTLETTGFKARGFEDVMQRFTGITIGIWLVLGFILVVLSTK